MAAKHLAKSLELAGLNPKDGSSPDDWDMDAAAAIAPGATRHSRVLGSALRAGEACEPQLRLQHVFLFVVFLPPPPPDTGTYDSSLGNLVRILHIMAEWDDVDFYLSALQRVAWDAVENGEHSPTGPIFTMAYGVSRQPLGPI